MPSPRILFLDHAGVLGGAELYLLDVARHYRRHSAVLLFEDGPFRTALDEADISVYVAPADAGVLGVRKNAGWMHALAALPGLFSLVLTVARYARSYDLLYANSQKSMVVAALASLLCRCPVVWNLHDLLTAEHFSSLNRRFVVALANRLLTRVIVNSEATRAAFIDSGGDATKTGLVYNGFDLARFSDPDSPSLKEELGLSAATPLVGVFSRLAPWKGQHVLLRALQAVPTVHAVLVGDALFRGDDAYAAQLREEAQALDVEDRVHFLGFRDDVPQLMHGLDAVLHTSTAPEPFGRVIVESQLVGTPVIATAAGGALEIIQTEVNGLLIPPGNEDALATAICRLLGHPDAAAALATRGQSDAEMRFSMERMLTTLDHQLSTILD